MEGLGGREGAGAGWGCGVWVEGGCSSGLRVRGLSVQGMWRWGLGMRRMGVLSCLCASCRSQGLPPLLPLAVIPAGGKGAWQCIETLPSPTSWIWPVRLAPTPALPDPQREASAGGPTSREARARAPVQASPGRVGVRRAWRLRPTCKMVVGH